MMVFKIKTLSLKSFPTSYFRAVVSTFEARISSGGVQLFTQAFSSTTWLKNRFGDGLLRDIINLIKYTVFLKVFTKAMNLLASLGIWLKCSCSSLKFMIFHHHW